MADIATTSISDLPTDPVGGGSHNVSMNISEKIPTQNQSAPNVAGSLSLDQTTINQIVSGLQQASSTGATQLPSRDIPRNTDTIVQDPYIQPNYIPPSPIRDYINEDETPEKIIGNYNRDIKNSNTLDETYGEIQTPLLLAVLFFLFQLPFFKKLLLSYIPALFLKDGNYNINGYIFMSLLFGLIYYVINKVINQFNTF